MRNNRNQKYWCIVLFAFLCVFVSFGAIGHTVKNDAGITAIISPVSNTLAGEKTVIVSLKNYGKDTLKSCYIYLKVNEITQWSSFEGNINPIYWSGNIKPDSSVKVYIGGSNNGYFVPFPAGTDTIIAWTKNPNGLYDSMPGNDTATTIIKVDSLPSSITYMGKRATIDDNAGILYDDGGPYHNIGTNVSYNLNIYPCADTAYFVIDSFDMDCGKAYLQILDGNWNILNSKHPQLQDSNGFTGGDTLCSTSDLPAIGDTFVSTDGQFWINENTTTPKPTPGFKAHWWSHSKPSSKAVAKIKSVIPSNDRICVNGSMAFYADSAASPGSNFLWDVDGDTTNGFEAGGTSITWPYFQTGTYTIRLVAGNCRGNYDTARVTITVYNPTPPIATFTANNTHPDTSEIVSFLPTQLMCVDDYIWTFTGPTGSSFRYINSNPYNITNSHIEYQHIKFNDTGCWTVSLFENNNGGLDSNIKTVNCYIHVRKIQGYDAGIKGIITPNDTVFTKTSVVKVLLKNYGLDTLKTVIISWSKNNSLQKTYHWKGSLPFDSSASVTLDTTVFYSLLPATITAWTSMPDGFSDSVPWNDTASAFLIVHTDTARPVITLFGGDTIYFNEGVRYIDSAYKAYDAHDGDISKNVVLGWLYGISYQKLVPGNYYRTYNVKDSAGNTAITVVVLLPDNVPPNLIISCPGNPDTLYVLQGSKFVDPGICSDIDLVDGDVSDSVKVYGMVNTSIIGEDTLQYTSCDFSGNCITKNRIVFVVASGAYFSVNDTYCINSPVLFLNNSKSYYCGTIKHRIWSFGDGSTDTAQNPSHTYTSAGVYNVILKDSSASGCRDSFSKQIYVSNTCVWPGDADNNKVVDTNDVLHIGIAYGETGAKRMNASTKWAGQYCDNWVKKFKNGANHNHADCNGDGVVDSNDIKIVNLNYGNRHLKTGANNTGGPASPPLYLSFSKTKYNAGDTVNGTIMLGTSTNSLSNAYGLEASLVFDPSFVDTNTLKINFIKSWFGSPGTDILSFVYPEYANGAILFAVTRIDHNNASGNGSIGTFNFIIPKNAPGNKSADFKLGSSNLISFNETVLPTYLPADTFSVNTTTGIEDPDGANLNLRISPNPFTSSLSISYALPQSQNVELILTDITGKEITTIANENQMSGFHAYVLDADKYKIPAGIYFLRMVAGNEAVVEKIVRVR